MKTNLVEDLSFSGIVNILQDGSDTATTMEFLQQLDFQYNEVKQQLLTLEKQMEQMKSERGLCVNAFVHAHRLLIKSSDKPLSFINSADEFVLVKSLENGNINYEKYPITIYNKTQTTTLIIEGKEEK